MNKAENIFYSIVGAFVIMQMALANIYTLLLLTRYVIFHGSANFMFIIATILTDSCLAVVILYAAFEESEKRN